MKLFIVTVDVPQHMCRELRYCVLAGDEQAARIRATTAAGRLQGLPILGATAQEVEGGVFLYDGGGQFAR